LDALPNDPDLLATLTQRMVDVTVLPEQPKSEGFNFVQSILFPGLLFLGLFFLSRRGRRKWSPSPMIFLRSGTQGEADSPSRLLLVVVLLLLLLLLLLLMNLFKREALLPQDLVVCPGCLVVALWNSPSHPPRSSSLLIQVTSYCRSKEQE